MKIYAHRGASQTHPENTLAAFREAIRLDVDGIELDVFCSADGVPVITHDRSLRRAWSVDANVDELSMAELNKLAPDLPTFRDVLRLAGSGLHFDIEVKQAGIEREVLGLLEEFPEARWAISCFDWNVLRAVRELDHECELWLLSMVFSAELVETAHALNATTAALYDPSVTEITVHEVRAAGLSTMAWTVNDPARVAQLTTWGVDALCTDAPHLFAD